MGWFVIATFALLWLLGWAAAYSETSVSQEKRVLKKIGGIILLFFVWPYIAWCMANQGDI
jgi:hypothetical protein